jgi:hypothetical protein
MEHAPMFDPADPWYRRVRELALALPGAREKVSHGHPAFYTRKVFAYYGGSLKFAGEWVQHPDSVVLFADLDGQAVLRAQPGSYIPGYLGGYGWTGLDLDEHTDLDDLADWLRTSWEVTAPHGLVAVVPRSDEPFLEILTGGRPRTLAGVEDVLAQLRAEPARVDEVVDCCSADDPVVRMRAADALEKFARERPDVVGPLADRLDAELSASTQPSIQWHLAQLWGQLPLTPAQHRRAAAWLLRTLDEADDWIVLANSMSALAALAEDDPSLLPGLRERLQRHSRSRLPSVAKRAGKLLANDP